MSKLTRSVELAGNNDIAGLKRAESLLCCKYSFKYVKSSDFICNFAISFGVLVDFGSTKASETSDKMKSCATFVAQDACK